MSEHVLTRDGIELHWWDKGAEQAGRSVVFTHGGAMDHHLWDAQVAALGDRYRVITHDLRGHGASRCTGAQFSLESAADDVLAIMDAAGIDAAVLVGHSFGATIAQLVALKAPERVVGFAGISAACVTLPFSRAARTRGALNPVALRFLGQQRVRKMFAEQAGVESSTRAYATRAIAAVSDDVFSAIMRTGFGAPVKVPPGYRRGVPLLLLQGDEESNEVFVANAREWADREDGRFVIVPNAAHNAGQDAPEFVNRELAEFLASVV